MWGGHLFVAEDFGTQKKELCNQVEMMIWDFNIV